MSGKANLQPIHLGKPKSYPQTSTSPQNLKKGCWDACGRKTVYTMGGAACGLVTFAAINMLIGAALLYSVPRMLSERESISNFFVFGNLAFVLPVALAKASLLGIPVGAVIGYRYANRV